MASLYEYVDETANNTGTNTITITRAQGGTTAKAFSAGAIIAANPQSRMFAAGGTGAFARIDGANQTPNLGRGPTVIDTQTAPGGTNVFTIGGTTLPTGYTNLKIELVGRSDVAALFSECGLRFSSDATANYLYQRLDSVGTSTGSTESGVTAQTSARGWYVSAATAQASLPGIAQIWIPMYNTTTFKKMVRVDYSWFSTAGLPVVNQLSNDSTTCVWNTTAVITRIDVYCLSGNWVAGTTATLVGI